MSCMIYQKYTRVRWNGWILGARTTGEPPMSVVAPATAGNPRKIFASSTAHLLEALGLAGTTMEHSDGGWLAWGNLARALRYQDARSSADRG